jgi:ubiquinone/menaquinone biosynthesis C-methylase UbiE
VPEISNRTIYNRMYSRHGLELKPERPYDAEMIDIRLGYIERFAVGKSVLDLCCGSGAYLLPHAERMASAIGVDFSRNLLDRLRGKLKETGLQHIRLIEGDAQCLPIRDAVVDFAFSYCALYYVPRLDKALAELARVLKAGGHAVLEIGNRHSLNQPVTEAFHAQDGWARPHYVPYGDLKPILRAASLQIIEHRCFQILPMYGTPRRLLPLMPLLSGRWKGLMARKIGGRMLDEWVSGSWPLRPFAFRHLVLVRKP